MRILKHEADALDCWQDVFLEAWERSRRGPVTSWEGLLRWLATRRAIDALRRRQRRSAGNEVDQLPDRAPSVEQQASFQELVERVRQELIHLPDKQAEAFWLVCVDQCSYGEVAAQMQIEANAVGVLVHRARQHMRTLLRTVHPEQIDERAGDPHE